MDGQFNVPAAVLDAYGLDSAHVEMLAGGRTNRTMRVRSGRIRAERDLVLQQLLGSAHGDLLGIMENLVRITSHLDWRRAVEHQGDSWYPVLVPSSAGKPFVMTEKGDVWRAFSYREGCIVGGAQTLETLAGAASLYGRFAAATADLGGPPLIETAPGFHDLNLVFDSLSQDCGQASGPRRAELDRDLDHIYALKARIEDRCAADGLAWRPDRVVHNDTKLSNVLFDAASGEAISVLDLDLAMMGPSWHDVGDLIRSSCWHAPPGMGEPGFTAELFATVVGSFVAGARETLTDDEIVTYAAAGPRLSFELGLRYLNDHVRDHPHLRVAGENGHLVRGRANLKLADEMLNAYDALRQIVDGYVAVR